MPSRAVVHGFYAVGTHFALPVGGFYAVGTRTRDLGKNLKLTAQAGRGSTPLPATKRNKINN